MAKQPLHYPKEQENKQQHQNDQRISKKNANGVKVLGRPDRLRVPWGQFSINEEDAA